MKNIALVLKRWMPLFFWSGLAFSLILTLAPVDSLPKGITFWDKAEHATAFMMLALLGLNAYPKHSKLICLGLMVYGASIELMQAYLTTTRSGDLLDLMADTIGIIIGLALVILVKQLTAVSKR